MPSESIPEDERLALARALRHVSEEDSPRRSPENQEEIARLFGDEAGEGPAESAEDDEPGRPRFRLLHLLIGLLVLACLALVVPLGMDFLGGEDSGEIPVIQAEQQPDKVRPEEPGGLQVPHQDLQVLNQGAETGPAEPERLLPPPETPEPLPQVTQDAVDPAPAPQALGGTPATEDTAASDAGDLPRPDTASPAEVAGDPGASQTPEAAAVPPPASAPTEAAAPKLEAAEVPPAKTQAPVSAPTKTEAPAESQQAALPPAAETSPAAGDGGIFIQLGSLSNKEGVPKEWARLQKAFPDFLGDMNLAVQSVTLEGRGTFHRIQAGPLPNRGTAEEMCAFLKDAKQACIVVKR